MVVEVTLRQLLDMSIGSPEIGAVNFNYMYSLLHIMIIRLEKLLEASFDAGILDDFSLRETVRLEATKEASHEKSMSSRRSLTGLTAAPPSRTTFPHASDASIIKSSVDGKLTATSESTAGSKSETTDGKKKKVPQSGQSLSSTSTKKTFSKSSSKRDTPLDDESRGSLGRSIIMSKQSWTIIQRKMRMLEDQVDTLLKAESEDILGHIQRYAPDLSTSQYIEMAQRVTQSKRMDVSEQLISQLSVMLEETNTTVNELKTQGGGAEMKSLVARVKEIEMTYTTDAVLEDSMLAVEKVLGLQLERPIKKRRVSSGEISESSEEDSGMKQTLIIVTQQTQTLMEMMDAKMDKELYSDITGTSPAILEQIQRIRHGAKFIEKYRLQYELQDKILTELINKLIDEGFEVSEVLQLKVQLEDELMLKLKEKDLLDDKISSIVSRRSMSDKSTESDDENIVKSSAVSKKLLDIERELRELTRKMEKFSSSGGMPHMTASMEDEAIMEDNKMKLLELCENFEGINEQITQIIDDGIDKQKQIQKIVETIGSLKESKAETEEVALLREEKADKMMVESKVDHEIFETALNQFHQDMGALEEKISYVDECHQTTMNTINDSLARKADRTEIIPLKEYINIKVRMLLMKIKKLTPTGPEDGAATRKQLLKRFHCISCDKPVVVTSGFGTCHAATPQLPARQSIGPFTSYEIELVRQQKKLGLGKKCQFKPTLSEMARSKRLQQEAARSQIVGSLGPIKDGIPQGLTEVPENVDTRYCGGSHTLTFPFQRVLKSGGGAMFDDIPIIRQEVQIQGTDGQFYKGAPVTSPQQHTESEPRKEEHGGGGSGSPRKT